MKKALLALADGTIFSGQSTSPEAIIYGELVFNTSTTGYQEIITDPSYANQIVVFTAPHIGNVGVNQDDNESNQVWVKGIIVLEMSKISSNWRSEQTLTSFLEKHQTPWIEGIDTRKLTRHIREYGSQNGCIMIGDNNPRLAVELAKKHIPLQEPAFQNMTISHSQHTPRIAIYDFGVKNNIFRMLSQRGCNINLFSSISSSEDILSWDPDGIVISNGPGDPTHLPHAIQELQKLIASELPILGICLGCQLIALALGGKTKKMKYGHHGTNHPVYDLIQDKTYITSQNHQYAIDDHNLPLQIIVTHRSLFDGTIQGIRVKDLPIFGFQGHPEGSPGPQDLAVIFVQFLNTIKTNSRDFILSPFQGYDKTTLKGLL